MSLTPGEVVAERLRELREARSWSQAKLATHLGMARPTVSAIEAGKRRVNVDELCEIAMALEVAPTWLYTWPTDDETTIALGEGVAVSPEIARSWARGDTAVPSDSAWRYFTQVPPDQGHEVFPAGEIEEVHSLALQLRRILEQRDETTDTDSTFEVETTVGHLIRFVEEELLRQRKLAARRTADPPGTTT